VSTSLLEKVSKLDKKELITHQEDERPHQY